MICSSSG